MSDSPPDLVSIEHETIFNGPFPIEQLGWTGAGLLSLFLLLAIRDYLFARRKWLVPFLFFLRSVACAGVLLALAAPSAMTRQTFESGQNRLGIYLDTSASMRLSDPVDGNGHMTRWDLAVGQLSAERSTVAAVDEAQTRVEVALALFADGNRELLNDQLNRALKIYTKHKNKLPWPGLTDEIIDGLKIAGKQELPRADIEDIVNRMRVVSRELARREESERKPDKEKIQPASRLQLAGELLDQVEAESIEPRKNDLEVLRYQFAEKLTSATERWQVKPAQNTDLNIPLKQIADQYRSGRIDAAILLTDALHSSGGKKLEPAAALQDVPLFLIPSGSNYKISDATLWRASAPTAISQGDFLSIDCLVGAQGFTGQKAYLKLLENGEELDSAEVVFDADNEDKEIRLTTKVKATGTHRFEVELTALPGESNTANNREIIEVNVFTGDLKVLLVDGWPRWETRYLSNLLRRDQSIEHGEILFAPTPPDPFPDTLTSIDQLMAFQIIVLGEIGPEFLGPVETANLETYINNGGNLIVMSGREFMPQAYRNSLFADIFPVWLDRRRTGAGEGMRVVPTAAGRRVAALSLEDDRAQNEAVWRLGSSLLSFSELSPYNLPKPGAQVILEAKPSGPEEALPFTVWHRYGAGRVFYFTSPTTWHLRNRFGDRYHYRFWGQFLRWATMAELKQGMSSIQISTNEKKYGENQPVTFRIELIDLEGNPVTGAKPGISLEKVRGDTVNYPAAEVAGKPGNYEVVLPTLKHGEYRATATGPAVEKLVKQILQDSDREYIAAETSFTVQAPPNIEDGERTCDWAAARKIIESSKGAILSPETLAVAIEVLAEKKAKVSREEVTKKPLWNRWPLFFIILIFLSLEWAGRKYAGLI